MFAVCVTFRIASGRMDDFMPLILTNAQTSVAKEPGCLRFDVLTDPERADEVFLYEIYTDPAAFDAHRDTAHFKIFDGAVTDMIAQKSVLTYRQVAT